ncbi:uncharacterized protein LOC129779787 [Toxorhynchites rutilus septentrionalis]|uniref:uncharacterized protein LOC129779787 n=1 Tax=Toxorhynchites rutilus septentrionalis TaxID=329112 RepID=UPI0024799DB6|nr:uncharacterized protein LOC129779787 [Toxorhynchites rutilus septentrionalis]
MPIVNDLPENESSAGFDLHKALFGDEAQSLEVVASGITSKTTQDTAEDQTRMSSAIFSSSDLYPKPRRVSSIRHDSFILDSLRKISVSRISTGSKLEAIIQYPLEFIQSLQSKHDQQANAFNQHMENVHSKLLEFGLGTISKLSPKKIPTVVDSLLDQMDSTRTALSAERRKLISIYRQLEYYCKRDFELDGQMSNVRLEELHDMQMEVILTGEKIDEISKLIVNARTQFERDISKASHVGQKWYKMQMKTVSKWDDLKMLKSSIYENRVYLCRLLTRKKQLRKKRDEWQKMCRIINNKPLLRKYDQMVKEIATIRHYTEKIKQI